MHRYYQIYHDLYVNNIAHMLILQVNVRNMILANVAACMKQKFDEIPQVPAKIKCFSLE